jgi:hypothetical protein
MCTIKKLRIKLVVHETYKGDLYVSNANDRFKADFVRKIIKLKIPC